MTTEPTEWLDTPLGDSAPGNASEISANVTDVTEVASGGDITDVRDVTDAAGAARQTVRQALERVSIILPAHNEEAYIEHALASVVAQNYPADQMECIVVNNASTDDTGPVARAFAAAHPECAITVIDEPVPGVARAKNTGARVAVGSILFFLDADSAMSPGLVHDIVAAYQRGAPAGCIRIVADSGDALERGFFNLMEIGPLLFGVRSQMPYCSARLFHLVGGFREHLHLAEDLDFFDRIRALVRSQHLGEVTHIVSSTVATSPRRLRTLPHHLSLVTVFLRWSLAFAGWGRERRYA